MKRTILGLAAAAALAAPATAAAATIEHSVSTISFESGYENRSERFERWVAADRAHQVITDTATGALRYEAAQDPLKFTAFDATRNELATITGDGAMSSRGTFVRSLPSQGDDIRTMIGKGWLAKTGETTFLGRAALTLATTSGAPGEARVATTYVVDAANLAPYRRITTGTSSGQSYKQTETVESFDTLPLAGNEHLLTLSDAGANAEQVTFEEQARRILDGAKSGSKPSAASKKKASSKSKKAKAKKQAKAKKPARR
ncbi:hypothetical protein OJ997_04865 [Solirubrobacter phytolaccae]|uniref:Uncharacterized protein n=1 Tax=Solirubrobacter phytolaccae TaxID=1404360 RepID=A0A9X3N4J7_9ACTN|nr:hypothetical protein [Solirubrobacter phytolaccae]MDA0179618.1 hypothetical protein [Solirubrobacter phytolaccae]